MEELNDKGKEEIADKRPLEENKKSKSKRDEFLVDLRKRIEEQALKVREMRKDYEEGKWREDPKIIEQVIMLLDLKHQDPHYMEKEYTLPVKISVFLTPIIKY